MTGAPELQACPHCGKQHPDDQLRCPITDLPLPLEGRVLDAKFRLVRELGTGGMAAVWLAVNNLVDKEVAIKLMRPDVSRDTETMARFRNEARAAGRIGSIHICDIFDFGQSPIGPYIVMELLQGENLAQLIQRRGKLEPGLVASIARDALSGLEAAHAAGIVHRDLKPENIFLHRRDDGSMLVKIMDFGVSKFTDGSSDPLTAHGMLLGTPQYMAPEQVQGAAHADPRTDVWALGAILYRALSGKDAFLGSTVAASLMKVSSEDPLPLEKLVPKLPSGLVEVVDRCLKRDPQDRFQRAHELSRALATYADDVAFQELAGNTVPSASAPTVLADAPKSPRASRGWRRPSRSMVWGIVTSVLVLAGGGLAWSLIAPVLNPQTPEAQALQPKSGEESQPSPKATKAVESPVEHQTEPAPTPAPAAKATEPSPADAKEPPEVSPDAKAEGEEQPGGSPQPSAPTEGSESPAAADTGPASGTLRAEDLLTFAEPGPVTSQPDAKTYCRLMAKQGHLGIDTWKLANPSEARAFANAKGLSKGRYWTTARWRGKAVAYVLPAGRKLSLSVRSKKARPLCVAPYSP